MKKISSAIFFALLICATCLDVFANDVVNLTGEMNKSANIEYVPGEVIVKLKPNSLGIFNDEVVSISNQYEIKAKKRLNDNMVLFENKNKDVQSLIAEISKKSNVEFVQPNYMYYTTAQAKYWNIGNNNNSGVNADLAWKNGVTGNGVVVAVLDTGVDWSHEDLANNHWTNTGETNCSDGIDNDGNGYIDDCNGWDFIGANCLNDGYCTIINPDNNPDDVHGHGTHCAGIISAENNSVGVVGVAYNAKIMAVKVMDNNGAGTTATVVGGINYAKNNGADVISMSLGTLANDPAMESAVNSAFSEGVVLVGASGNAGVNTPHYPAAYANVIAVGATDSNNTKASFSNYGSWLDVVAPGTTVEGVSGILSTYPGDLYAGMHGTSMAAPHVSGVVALILEQNPTYTPSQVKQALIDGATDLGDAGFDNNYGYGLVNAYKSTFISSTSPGDIVINELAWAGSSVSTADEWIELRNTTNQPINISGWQLTANTGTESLMLEIPSASIVPPYGYFLISNYSEASSNLNITPDLVTTAVLLDNDNLKITLYNGVWNMGATGIDIAGDGGAPLAGSNGTPKASMARKWHGGDGTDADNWFTHQLSSGFDAGATEKGSPGNSTSNQNQAFPETVYEDAESGDIAIGWKIFGPAGATITNVNDSGNRIITTSGSGLQNMYRLYKKVDGIGWNNQGQFIAQWKMKHLVPNNAINTNFRVFWRVIATDNSVAYIGYKPGICAPSQIGNTIYHCINFVNKGDFYTFTRNLQADYSAVAGGNLVKVHGFLVRGDVDLDDIKLLSSQTGLYNISGNVTYDHDNNAGTAEVPLENALISFSGRPPVYTDASGNYTQDGFADKGSYTVTVEKAGVNFATSTATVNINSANATQNFAGGIPDATPTVYEDAEDGNTDGWDINDNSPAGATIANIIDGAQGRVIEFIGNALVYGAENGNSARLRNADGTGWNNNGQFNISFDIKGIDGLDADADNDDFMIYVSVNTTAGQRWLKYSNSDTDFGNDYSREIHHGLGSNANDGTWRTFTRNLQTDLNADPPSGSPETILSVNELRIRGSLRVDNIELQ